MRSPAKNLCGTSITTHLYFTDNNHPHPQKVGGMIDFCMFVSEVCKMKGFLAASTMCINLRHILHSKISI